ncbi:ADP-ribosylation factor-like protein 2-binding protein [Trebouxia sp. C0010 RCD-2024]
MGGPQLASDKPRWRSMTSFLKRPFIGTSAVSFVDEDNSQDHDMQVGDDCEEYAEDEVCAQDDGALDLDACHFDATVGVLQDILLDPSFQEVQTAFCQKHCHKFEDADENKLFYTQVFQEYQAVVERSLEQRLSAAIPNFSMDTFIAGLDTRRNEIMEELLDLLMSFVDFQAFKELMLAHKSELRTCSIHVDVSKAVMHSEEQEEGDIRSDLDSELHVSKFIIC